MRALQLALTGLLMTPCPAADPPTYRKYPLSLQIADRLLRKNIGNVAACIGRKCKDQLAVCSGSNHCLSALVDAVGIENGIHVCQTDVAQLCDALTASGAVCPASFKDFWKCYVDFCYEGNVSAVLDQPGYHHFPQALNESEIKAVSALKDEILSWPLRVLYHEDRNFGTNSSGTFGSTTYMSKGHKVTFLNIIMIEEWAPGLLSKLQLLAKDADKYQGWGLWKAMHDAFSDSERPEDWNVEQELPQVRCVEHIDYTNHEVEANTTQGGNKNSLGWHGDFGSLVTISVMLSNPEEDFTGGLFEIKKGGYCGLEDRVELKFGDVLVWQSSWIHRVAPVLSGSRSVLVVELWEKGQNMDIRRPSDTQDDELEHMADIGRLDHIVKELRKSMIADEL